MDFLFYSLHVKHLSYSPWPLSFLVFLSPLALSAKSANTVFAAKIHPQLSFPTSGAERKGLKRTSQFLSPLCDETGPRMLVFLPFPTETMLSYTTFILGLIFNYIFHKYLP